MMKQTWMAMALGVVMTVAAAGTAFVSTDAEAKRLGGGRSQGMQRQAPPPNTANQTPATPAQQAPTNAAAAAPLAGGAAAAAAPKRNWMGPIAGLAAGLGIAALMSHLGMGEAFGNFLMMALLAVAAIFLVRFLMRRFGGGAAGQGANGMRLQPAGAGMAPMGDQGFQRRMDTPASSAGNSFTPASTLAPVGASGGSPVIATAAQGLPEGFDREGFERIAKMIFIRLQTANDAGDLNDLRNFTTPEMFAAIRLELQERGATTQQTDVMKVDAEVIDVTEETERQVVSVRFHGLVREEREAAATDFDEVWHLVKPNDDSRSWAIAGIQQR
jgi:predicted lipid-binding transport protein (Tim44 family)